jgi:DNA-binding transcriptional LysR family regulator
MDWSDLQVFVTVVRTGTVRAAGRALRLDASTVSRRISSLEAALGVRLFERTARGLVLTPSGKVLIESGERVRSELDEVGRRVAGHDRRLSGVVRITFPGSFTRIVHESVTKLTSRHPAIEVELLTLDALVDVDGRQADIAIRISNGPPEHLVGRRVAFLAGALYASRDYLRKHRGPLSDPEHAFVGWDRRLAGKPAIAWVEERFPSRRIAARGLSTADVLAAVMAGCGVGPLPCLVGDAEPSLVRLLDAPREVWSSAWLLTHADLRPAARVRAVLSHLFATLRDARDLIEGSQGPAERIVAST